MLIGNPPGKRNGTTTTGGPATRPTWLRPGYVGVTPLQMACFMAFARPRQTYTKPTLLHVADARPTHRTGSPVSGELPGAAGRHGAGRLPKGLLGGRRPGLHFAPKPAPPSAKLRDGRSEGKVELACTSARPIDAPEIASGAHRSDTPDESSPEVFTPGRWSRRCWQSVGERSSAATRSSRPRSCRPHQ